MSQIAWQGTELAKSFTEFPGQCRPRHFIKDTQKHSADIVTDVSYFCCGKKKFILGKVVEFFLTQTRPVWLYI